MGFNASKFKAPAKNDVAYSLVLEEEESLLDELLADMPAQYANDVGTPSKAWRMVKSDLSSLDTTQLHYVKVPEGHIVIDFDLKDDDGNKSLDRNLQAASLWPPTYAELSQGGAGVHLHYEYVGEVSELRADYSDGIEVKTLPGDSSLRRRLSRCNNVAVASLNGGLPLKEKKMLGENTIKSEKGLRDLIARNMRKEIHPGTKPSIDFIHKILEDAQNSGMQYDVTDLRPRIFAFAATSSNQSLQAIKVVQKMAWKSEDDHYGDDPIPIEEQQPNRVTGAQAFIKPSPAQLVFFDVEVYPNLFVVCWKFEGKGATVVRMINPKPHEVEALFKMRLVGFNNRRYDNHIMYAAFMGYTNQALFELSEKIVNNDRSGMFGEAYNLSYADIYDFSSKKQGLKKFQIELGLHHQEMDIPWDQPVPDKLIDKVVDYCCNDVLSTEATFESRRQDFVARMVLSELSGLSPNDTTQRHTAKILFGNDRSPQEKFIYTDLSKEFPGYEFELGKSSYRGEDPSEGGYVDSRPGIYHQVGVLDIASMHPTSIINLDLFGEYTPRFKELLDARIAIKHRDYDRARTMLDGKLAPYLESTDDAAALAYALKIVINIVYGLTSAKFPNPFRDNRNVDNIVAKRGALFMIDLKNACQEKGWEVVHIKTDSIKLANITDEMIHFVTEFGKKYGYDFEHEVTYESFALVNDAVYIARKPGKTDGGESHEGVDPTDGKTPARGNWVWEAVGAQFQHPYVFKKLFSNEEITFDDLCETKQVTKGAMNLELKTDELTFVGRTGRFVPVKDGNGGGALWRVQEGKKFAVTGTKGYLWVESEIAKSLPLDAIDMSYFEGLAEEAVKNIEKFGNFKELF